MARGVNKRGGLISRGKCEGCKLDLGNVLDPYCWRCAQALERIHDANRRQRAAERVARQQGRVA